MLMVRFNACLIIASTNGGLMPKEKRPDDSPILRRAEVHDLPALALLCRDDSDTCSREV